MTPRYKNKVLLKIQLFYSSETESFKRKNKKINNTKIFSKNPNKLSDIKLSKQLPFFPKKEKRPKRLTTYQVLSNIIPFYDNVEISRREHACKYYAETYGVEVIDNTSLDYSLYLAKRSINDLFRDLLKEERGFKYNLYIVVTLKTQLVDLIFKQ